jgi:hypothetical protein
MFQLDCMRSHAKLDITDNRLEAYPWKSVSPVQRVCACIATKWNRTPARELWFKNTRTHQVVQWVRSMGSCQSQSTPQPSCSNKNLFHLNGYVMSQNNH